MRYLRVCFYLVAISTVTGACASPSIEKAYGQSGFSFADAGAGRTIFSSHNF